MTLGIIFLTLGILFLINNVVTAYQCIEYSFDKFLYKIYKKFGLLNDDNPYLIVKKLKNYFSDY